MTCMRRCTNASMHTCSPPGHSVLVNGRRFESCAGSSMIMYNNFSNSARQAYVSMLSGDGNTSGNVKTRSSSASPPPCTNLCFHASPSLDGMMRSMICSEYKTLYDDWECSCSAHDAFKLVIASSIGWLVGSTMSRSHTCEAILGFEFSMRNRSSKYLHDNTRCGSQSSCSAASTGSDVSSMGTLFSRAVPSVSRRVTCTVSPSRNRSSATVLLSSFNSVPRAINLSIHGCSWNAFPASTRTNCNITVDSTLITTGSPRWPKSCKRKEIVSDPCRRPC
mmetsp:Transcript_54231/g.110665  ORF Transcript_54231/g.110665 Transcript_54231/m.110665 type:complete len:278 (-) Transcript_54231:658-1491(-)